MKQHEHKHSCKHSRTSVALKQSDFNPKSLKHWLSLLKFEPDGKQKSKIGKSYFKKKNNGKSRLRIRHEDNMVFIDIGGHGYATSNLLLGGTAMTIVNTPYKF